jgi:prepilin-type N-terminal cleavage/methylation domain-containing protein
MKKKGFTLVELLAVIAILAILVIIALPNVLGMFNQAKKNTFVTELQSIYDTAATQFVSDSMGDMSKWSGGITYARVSGTRVAQSTESGYKLLDLQGTNAIDYYIHFNLAGEVTEFYATDKQYQFIYNGPGLKKERIGATNIAASDHALSNDALDNPPTTLVVSVTAGTIGTAEVNTGVITIADAQSYLPKQFSRVALSIADNGKTGNEKIDNYKCTVAIAADSD